MANGKMMAQALRSMPSAPEPQQEREEMQEAKVERNRFPRNQRAQGSIQRQAMPRPGPKSPAQPKMPKAVD
jgi:hypothetical protein